MAGILELRRANAERKARIKAGWDAIESKRVGAKKEQQARSDLNDLHEQINELAEVLQEVWTRVETLRGQDSPNPRAKVKSGSVSKRDTKGRIANIKVSYDAPADKTFGVRRDAVGRVVAFSEGDDTE
jgi:hypothetical protein